MNTLSLSGLYGVVIVVPCFNEAQRLRPETFQRFAALHPGARFVFVDDGSTDATRGMLQALCACDRERFEVLTLDRNMGQGEAVRTGVARALAGDARYVGYWDADLATPLEEIPRFVDALDRDPQCLIAIGSRKISAHNHVRRKPVRFALGRMFAWATAGVLRMGIYDTQCSAKLFRRTPETEAFFATAFISRWIFDVEILVRLIRAKGSKGAARRAVHEVSLHTWSDVDGSKVTALDFARAPFELLRIGITLFR